MNKEKSPIDKQLVILPVIIIALIVCLLTFFPASAEAAIGFANDLFVNKMGFFYILMGLVVLIGSVAVASSRFGRIHLGEEGEKPEYSNFKWGSMIFTSTMAADILYWSLIEWGYYYSANPEGLTSLTEMQRQLQASSYPLFHWGPIPWAFYLLPAAAYAYMFHVKKCKRQTLSEACRPLLGNRVDGPVGKVIDIFAIVGLLAGTATTFSLATPLISEALCEVTGLQNSTGLTILILLFIGLTFTLAVMIGMKAISKLASICVLLFALLLAFVFIGGPGLYIIESGVSGIGHVVQNFIGMATFTDPLRQTGDGVLGFPQMWTIFYWAYWIAWFVATPFFIAKISKGRSIRQMIFGGFFFGIAGTFCSFIVFGNFGLYQQTSGAVDAAGMLEAGAAPAEVIVQLFGQLPFSRVALVLLVLAMVAFYSSTFDALTLVVAGFCHKKLGPNEDPSPVLRAFWCVVFILLPIALLNFGSTLGMLQTLSVTAAFPLSIIMLLIIGGFVLQLRRDEAKRAGKEPAGGTAPPKKAAEKAG